MSFDMDMSQFHAIFFEEAAEHLAAMENLLLGLSVDSPDAEDLNAIFRAAHSIKGSSSTFGFPDMAAVTHDLETLLDRVRKHELPLTAKIIDTTLAAKDVLRLQLAAHQGGEAVGEDEIQQLCVQIRDLAETPASSSPVVAKADLLGDETCSDQAVDALPESDSVGGDALLTATDTEVLAVVEPSAVSAATSARASSVTASTASSIRVSVERVDQLINLVGELVITQSMLAQTAQVELIENESLYERLQQLERNTRELQEAVMSIRMLPVSSVFNRFPRLVHDLAGKLDKLIDFKTFGESTELDRSVIEKITDPLTHLVRNSVDHGIELPAERERAGKSARGTVSLLAFHQGGSVVIQIQDDGGGLDRERLLRKAREKGLPISESPSDQEVWQLIFAPGFSTADKVTDISGRGVGMDVVRRNIEKLGGRVEISSAQGKGTTTTIRLPLTLAIMDGMSVGIGEQTYIVPLTAIIESLRPLASDVKSIAGQGCLVFVRGEYLPLISLYEVFALTPKAYRPEDGILIIVDTENGRAALFVDELLGQRQVVIKSLESNYHKVAGISAATIMGDGSVSMILDVSETVRLGKQKVPLAVAV